jgi:hypothetical protein
MNRIAIWAVLLASTVLSATLVFVHFEPTASTVGRVTSPGQLTPAHAYLERQCTSCHEAGVGVTVTKCVACHAANARLLGRQPTVFHASIDDCATCHVEHQRTGIRPPSMDHVALAQIGARTLARAARRDHESAATFSSLQTWLRVRAPANLDSSSARAALDCAGCHDRRDPHFKRFGGDCAQCHATESWKIHGYQHPSARSRDCVQCHQAPPSHSMEHFFMVSQRIAGKEHANVNECFECHNTTSWNDIVDVGFYKHH